MGDGTTFDIDIKADGAGVESAAAAVARLATELTQSAAAYKQAESAADKAAKTAEKMALAVDAQTAKAAAAAEKYGIFSTQYQKASEKLERLTVRQAEAAGKSQEASAAMNEAAAAADGLSAKATAAAAAQKQLSDSADAVAKAEASAAQAAKQAADAQKQAAEASVSATKKAADAQKQAAAQQKQRTNDAAEALGKLGGPVGFIGQKFFSTKAAVGKLNDAFGEGKGQAIAAAAGLASVAAAAAAAAAAIVIAAAVGIGAITLWAIKLADTDGQLGKLGDRLKKNFTKIFGGLNIKPLLAQLEKIGDLFDEGSASANAIKTVFNSIFQPIVDGIAEVLPKAVAFFIQLEIMALKALIFIKPYGGVLEAIAIGFGVVIVVLVVLAALLVGFAVAMTAVVALIISIPFWITDAFNAAVEWLSSLSFTEIGTNLIQGLIDGLLGAGGGVLKAITGIVGGAIDGAKSLLGIASPSKVFAEIGMHTAAGMEEGIDSGAADVQASMGEMADPSGAAAGAGSTVSSSTGTYNITINGGDGASIAAALRALFADLGAQAGTAVPSAA